ncbi:MAG: SDR family oxidoreductase [Chloroflexi bacterium]|nr:SDR family oxidoreductase [Chloroflexota bacterium]
MINLNTMFETRGLKIIVTGGGGVLCGNMAVALAKLGASIAILDIDPEKARQVVEEIARAGGDAFALACDVTQPESVRAAYDQIRNRWDRIDVLVNGAGGNHPSASTNKEVALFDLDPDAVNKVFALNFTGTFIPSQIFGKAMAAQGNGNIVNIASMNSVRPLTRIPAYSAAKAAVANFTQWLAVHMAQEYSPQIRVNAIAPGFFITKQTRFLLTNPETGGYTPRGQAVIAHTPMKRMGEADDLLSTLIWLISPGASFVTGIMVPVDGGFSAFSGV